MPMGSIDDKLHAKKKIAHLLSLDCGPSALGLWTLANSWCNDELTDGAIELFVIKRLGPWTEQHADALVSVGLWSKTDTGYQFHDWEDFNDTRDNVLKKRAGDAERKGQTRSARRAKKALERSVSKQEKLSARNPSGIQSESERSPDGVRAESRAPLPLPLPLPLATQDIPAEAGEDGDGAGKAERPPSPKPPKSDPVFDHWVRVMAKDPARTLLTSDRRKKLKAMRAEGYTDEQLCQAVDGCKRSEWHMGRNPSGQAYNDLVTILRDGATVQAHMERGAKQASRPGFESERERTERILREERPDLFSKDGTHG